MLRVHPQQRRPLQPSCASRPCRSRTVASLLEQGLKTLFSNTLGVPRAPSAPPFFSAQRRAMAAAAPVPQAVVARLARPLDADPRVVLETDSLVVSSTPCLAWSVQPAAGAAPATASLPSRLMMRFFLSRARISRSLPSLDKSSRRSALCSRVAG